VQWHLYDHHVIILSWRCASSITWLHITYSQIWVSRLCGVIDLFGSLVWWDWTTKPPRYQSSPTNVWRYWNIEAFTILHWCKCQRVCGSNNTIRATIKCFTSKFSFPHVFYLSMFILKSRITLRGNWSKKQVHQNEKIIFWMFWWYYVCVMSRGH
jgi:hypothetical protein